MKSIPWKTALVTGASSGIGEAFAVELAAAGIPTVIVARRADRLEALAREHPMLEPLPADLADPVGIQRVVDRLSDPKAPIDLLVNNAGFGVAGTFAAVPAERHLGMIDVNVSALVALTHAALGPMLARRRGWIVQVSSLASFQPGPSAATYSATKAFVTSLSEALHEELRGSGVTITASCPGFTRTEFHEASGSEEHSSAIPDLAWLQARDVARSALRATASGRALDVPGLAYKGVAAMSAPLPRFVKRRLMGLGASTLKD